MRWKWRLQQRCLSLPELHPLLRRQIFLVTGLHAKRVVPRIDISRGAHDTEVRGRMRVGEQALPGVALTVLGSPDLGIGEKESLVTSEAVELWCGLATK